jgi:hypothetical protein
MTTQHYVIGKMKSGQTIPTELQVFASKFEREVGDRITFEGQSWIVQCDADSKNDAHETLKVTAALYVELGHWKGRVSKTSKF